MSSGIAGITRKTFVRKFTTSSRIPPAYPAVMPRIAASAVASAPARKPSSNERRAPTTTCEKMSLPWSVVPNRWFHDGDCRVARMLKSFGWATEISGAISATTMTKATITRPVHDFRLRRRRTNQPGTLQPPVPARRHRGQIECDRVELRHEPVRKRGSRTKLRMSMSKLAKITQRESTTRSACASG